MDRGREPRRRGEREIYLLSLHRLAREGSCQKQKFQNDPGGPLHLFLYGEPSQGKTKLAILRALASSTVPDQTLFAPACPDPDFPLPPAQKVITTSSPSTAGEAERHLIGAGLREGRHAIHSLLPRPGWFGPLVSRATAMGPSVCTGRPPLFRPDSRGAGATQ